VRAAWKRRIWLWSLQEPEDEDEGNGGDKRVLQANYFPQALQHSFGPLPTPSETHLSRFPRNVSFRSVNWLRDVIPEDEKGYDIVVA
jgi:7SK snRNA methylphosphate capping enzyme